MLYAESLADIRPTKMVNIDIFRHLKDEGQYSNLDEIWDLHLFFSNDGTEMNNSFERDASFSSLLPANRDEPGDPNDNSNGNIDQRSQIMDQHDLSDSDALPLLNPNEVIPLVLPIAPSYKEVQTKGNATEERLQAVLDSVENRDSDDKSVVIKDEPIEDGEPAIESEPEPIDTGNGDEKESKASESEQHSGDVMNGRTMKEEAREEDEEEDVEELKKEELKQEGRNEEIELRQAKHGNEVQEDIALLTPPDFQTPLSSPTDVADVDVDASSVSSLMVSPIKLMRLSQSESNHSPEHAVYRIKRDRRKKREPPMIIPPYQPQQPTIENEAPATKYPKPPYSYSVLIMLALKNSYRGALRVCDIYSFICYHFPYFRTAPAGWKNSVRHNLSLNNRFEKVDDDDDDDGDGEPKNSTQKKGGLWRYAPDKTKKLVETMKSRSKKDPAGVSLSMSEPHMIDRLERGEMKFVVGNPNMEYMEDEGYMEENDEEGSSDENSMQSMPSVTLEADGQQSLLHEDEEDEAIAITQEHVEAHFPQADNGLDESHEEGNGNANQIEVYGQVHATSLSHQVHLHLQEVSPIQKRRKISNSEPVQNAPVVLQVQENTVRRRIAVRPPGSQSGPQAGPSRLQAGPLGTLAPQSVTTTPQYVILNIDKSLL
ncbi:PREDICTED: forkhead box protein P1-B-like [Dinoponera quadriceps]|uniref:Forkhead box protein P1-B-like n=1 Tax=Dinoponera quadriceps TaxID=609295 RepID=A0A6P3XFZ6_DINQU|nr:PREDICTED: forkhead box protein P1-B-like [Dinoponera quadriceps]XP_014476797.1 PREDICTED: forkhead box protein P1-B-like [Dinoponera quadriceps]XP_014476805.1 PREDICTED: forkhead box protein P1-B-like [Dinoponera quadriceps]XP_014476813.1 PREDICTED: forkhead box protein P1-B-like [Dinoponera quadriceps]XP_014476823.1 PREDICTED: forkhead box protein P1-B-like [Dinoponera quadriceps]XP_014476834.1 PREDICTED: forkhead box protein P1-B-like [Dinoponera quadriceps]